MGMWELRTEGCAVPLARDSESGTWIGHSEVAEYFVHYHNADIDALTAERDRLAVENAELRKEMESETKERKHYHQKAIFWEHKFVAANATLDKLREKVPEGTRWCSDCEKMTLPDTDDPDFCAECEGEDVWTRGVLVDIQAILYPKETSDAG